jgi:hypothetical protein
MFGTSGEDLRTWSLSGNTGMFITRTLRGESNKLACLWLWLCLIFQVNPLSCLLQLFEPVIYVIRVLKKTVAGHIGSKLPFGNSRFGLCVFWHMVSLLFLSYFYISQRMCVQTYTDNVYLYCIHVYYIYSIYIQYIYLYIFNHIHISYSSMRSLVKLTNSPSLDQGKKPLYPAQLPTSQLTCAKANSETVKENLRGKNQPVMGWGKCVNSSLNGSWFPDSAGGLPNK